MEKLYEEGKIKKKPEKTTSDPPPLFPDLYWIWSAYCVLSERRGVGPNGPVPITTSDMLAFAELSGRNDPHHRHQLLRFIPPLDRFYLKDFYEKQAKEMEKSRRKAESKGRSGRKR